MCLSRNVRGMLLGAGGSICLTLCLVLCALVTAAESQQSSASQAAQTSSPAGASLSGTVVDQQGAVAVGAKVQLTRAGETQGPQVQSGGEGQFAFSNVAPGAFQLTITAAGFETKTVNGTLTAGQVYIVPEVVLNVAATTTDVKVGLTGDEAAEVQVKEQEKQRVLGFIPNFYATYVPDAAPLPPRLKFQLAWKSVTDPISILGVGMLAGIYQASDQLNGYGQGAEGYGKRFGAVYGDVFIGTFIDSAILPTLLHQDPRYFYRGPNSEGSRFMYAVGNAVICKGDNKKYQPNYSAILGSFITGAIAQSYYPASDRGTSLYFQTALIRIAEGSVAGIFQEYVVPKLTPRLKKHTPQQQP
jgi:hypothetical protein